MMYGHNTLKKKYLEWVLWLLVADRISRRHTKWYQVVCISGYPVLCICIM